MMLTIYCQTQQGEQSTLPKNKGDVLENYFERHLEKAIDISGDSPSDISIARFIYRFCLPYIASRMGNAFEMKQLHLKKYLLESWDVFNGYHQLDEFGGYLDIDFTFEANKILYIMQSFAVLTSVKTDTKDVYKFSHQHFRDFLSARYYYLTIKLSIELEDDTKLLSQFSSYEISNDVLKFIGEISKDYKRTPSFDRVSKQWVNGDNGEIYEATYNEQCFNLLRGNFSEEAAIAVHNLVKVCLFSRKGDLSKIDLSKLNLSNVCFNNTKYFDEILPFDIRCSRATWNSGHKSLSVNFSGSLLSDENLLPQGHASSVDTMLRVNDYSFYTFSGDSIAFHDLSTKKVRRFRYSLNSKTDSGNRQKIVTGSIFAAKFINGSSKNTFFTFDFRGNIARWEIKENCDISVSGVAKIDFCPTTHSVICYEDYIIIGKLFEKNSEKKFFHYYNIHNIFDGGAISNLSFESSIDYLNSFLVEATEKVDRLSKLDSIKISKSKFNKLFAIHCSQTTVLRYKVQKSKMQIVLSMLRSVKVSKINFADLSILDYSDVKGIRISIQKSNTGFYFSMSLNIFHYDIKAQLPPNPIKRFNDNSFVKSGYQGNVCTGQKCNKADSGSCLYDNYSSENGTQIEPIQIKTFLVVEDCGKLDKVAISVLGRIRNSLFIYNASKKEYTLINDKCVNPKQNFNQFNYFSLIGNEEPSNFLVTVNNGRFYEYSLEGPMKKSFVGHKSLPSNVRQNHYTHKEMERGAGKANRREQVTVSGILFA